MQVPWTGRDLSRQVISHPRHLIVQPTFLGRRPLERRSSNQGPGFGVVATGDRGMCYSLFVAGGEGSATAREEFDAS
jgi:hypothetical protein